MSIGFVIVTYNSESVLPACLKSIPSGYEAVVVDNASKDKSAQIARSLGARVIVNKTNIGFGAACNRGAKLLSASHVFFLNPDAILLEGAVSEIEKAIGRYPDAGGFGPAIAIPGKRQKFRSTSYPQYQGRPNEGDVPPAGTAEVDFLDGAALICDLELFLKIGGFDEGLFLYYDDDDLCFRLRSQNRTLIYVATANVMHHRNRSSGNGIYLDYFRSYHAARSRIFISNKYTLPLDAHRERKRAIIVLLRSIVALNVRKAAKCLGTLNALRLNEPKFKARPSCK
ncbi:MAG: glycosyltransferase family 2 protein [Rhodomicrobium sp.]